MIMQLQVMFAGMEYNWAAGAACISRAWLSSMRATCLTWAAGLTSCTGGVQQQKRAVARHKHLAQLQHSFNAAILPPKRAHLSCWLPATRCLAGSGKHAEVDRAACSLTSLHLRSSARVCQRQSVISEATRGLDHELRAAGRRVARKDDQGREVQRKALGLPEDVRLLPAAPGDAAAASLVVFGDPHAHHRNWQKHRKAIQKQDIFAGAGERPAAGPVPLPLKR